MTKNESTAMDWLDILAGQGHEQARALKPMLAELIDRRATFGAWPGQVTVGEHIDADGKCDAALVKFLPLIDVAKLRLAYGDVLIIRVDDKKLPPGHGYDDETLYSRLHASIADSYPGLRYIVVPKRLSMELAIKRANEGPKRKGTKKRFANVGAED